MTERIEASEHERETMRSVLNTISEIQARVATREGASVGWVFSHLVAAAAALFAATGKEPDMAVGAFVSALVKAHKAQTELERGGSVQDALKAAGLDGTKTADDAFQQAGLKVRRRKGGQKIN